MPITNTDGLLSWQIAYHIAGYLGGMQFSRMSSIYHKLVIFTDALFAKLHLTNDILRCLWQALSDLNARADGRN